MILDIIGFNFEVNFDALNIRSGGDGMFESDFGQEMGQENGSNDMMNDAGQNYPNQTGPDPKYFNSRPAYDKNNPLQEHYHETVTLSDWIKANEGLSREQIINQTENRSSTPLNSQKGGPAIRYVFHPKTGCKSP